MQKENFKKPKALKVLLAPITFIYWFIVYTRNKYFDLGLFNIKSLGKPVISIGNLTVGGTAKTPLTIFISEYFKLKGVKVAILSRGYGRKSKGTVLVSDGINILSSHVESGDEPALIAKKTTGIPIVVDNKRSRGGSYLISKYNPDLIILDDGYQHRSLKRDLDILLINSLDKEDDHNLIPYGRLREPWNNFKRASLLIRTKSNLLEEDSFLLDKLKKTNKDIFISESHVEISKNFTSKKLQNINLSKKSVLVLTAIGDQQSFIKPVKKTGCKIVKNMKFRDHYNFNQKVWNKIESSIKSLNINYILTTEKDWVKIQPLKRKTPVIVFELNITIDREEDFFKILKSIL